MRFGCKPESKADTGFNIWRLNVLNELGRYTAAVHHGNFDDFTQAHLALLKWIEANGYKLVGPFREIYIRHDKRNLSNTVTEIQMPVEKA